MAITGGRFNEMWAQYFDGAHGYSVNVQGRGVGAICEVTLISHWGSGSVTGSDISVTGSDIFITQSISANGVEEFPKDNRAGLGAQTRLDAEAMCHQAPGFRIGVRSGYSRESDRTASMPAPRF
jgi:hypothetical protein